jgi:hypothetical protein
MTPYFVPCPDDRDNASGFIESADHRIGAYRPAVSGEAD